jgi:UDP-N-acetylmuramoyl-tripeptide--D-alanyl-D-alanine ligase
MLLSQCLPATGGSLVKGDCEFNSLSTDTRNIRAGDLFVALRGKNFDGHAFLQQAVDAGACALVVEQVADDIGVPQLVVDNTTRALGSIAATKREQFDGALVAITGSSGKTTVKGMLAAIFAECGPTKATLGNLNNHIGVPLTLMRLESGDQFAVIEMGASGLGEISYLASLAKPQVALVNNVMAAHIEGFGSLEGVSKEKGQIYGPLPEDGHAVINLDDKFAPYFLGITDGKSRWGFSVGEPGTAAPAGMRLVKAQDVAEDALGRASFELTSSAGSITIQLGVVGRHNVSNALAAAACALAAGASLEAVRAGLAVFSGESGRMQVGKAWNGASLVNDTYNANPGSVRAAIDYLSSCTEPTVLVLGNLGELGGNATEIHAELGIYAKEKGIGRLLTCGDLAQAAAKSFGENAQHFASQDELVASLRSSLQPSAVVLVKGSRSARMENIVTALGQTGE